ncbi:hypothetical protein EV702DRAFT_1282454 [Suillus placidus]|uniref:Uncharacterized protein n=1 Tax=Suillus placidus TaxID=48579 RepID=A0A9P7CXH4_9AGAM|nr:hypothetical protein EV702DRAFT_1282454 [Suillus placidus]
MRIFTLRPFLSSMASSYEFKFPVLPVLGVVAALTGLTLLRLRRKETAHPYPPGPSGLPIIGSALKIDFNAPHLTYTNWANQYGEIVYSRILGDSVIFVNTESMKYGMPVDWWAFGCVLYELMSPPYHKAGVASCLAAILLISSRQELFDSADAIMEYVSWHSKHYGTFDLFPAFHQLDPPMADLLVGLLNPLALLRISSNEDGTSELNGTCSRALQREKQPHMLPKLWDEQIQPAKIWCAANVMDIPYVFLNKELERKHLQQWLMS